MLKTERPVTQTQALAKRPERVAWAIMLSAFAIFCLLTLVGGMLAYRWLNQPPVGVLRAEVQQTLAAQVQPAGLVRQVRLETGAELNPGDRIEVSQEAAPGPATTLRFGSAAIQLWAGANVQIGPFGRQWNDPTTARLQLQSGQMLIEIARDDQRIEVRVGQNAQPIVLEGSGRYRVRIIEKTSPTTALAEQSDTRAVEIATERGRASIGEVTVGPGQRLTEALNKQTPRLTQWELLRDGNFQQLVNWVYDQANSPMPPWSYNVQSTAEGAARTGQIRATQDCVDPIARTDCKEPYVRLVRMGGNDKGFSTAIAQQINADVSSYRQVRLRAKVKVVSQSLSKAGESGTECPLLIRVNYTNDVGQFLQKDYCFWAFEYPGMNGVVSQQPHISTQQLTPNAWYDFDIDLKQQIDHLVKIHEISFQANGHDYESQVGDVHLTAEGLAEIPMP
jgi:hypothetical protein